MLVKKDLRRSTLFLLGSLKINFTYIGRGYNKLIT